MIQAFPAALLLCLNLCGGCDSDPVAAPVTGPLLDEIDTVELSGVPEPSGLVFDLDGSHLWTVSDQTGSIYRLTTGGTRVATIDIGGQDLDGIALDPADGTLFVVEKGLGQVLHVDREGNILERLTPAGLPDMSNAGLEGVTIELDFATDYSGLAFDAAAGQLLVISDQSATLTWCTTDGKPRRTLATGLEKGEGIALDPDRSVFYAVSDSWATLTSYQVSE